MASAAQPKGASACRLTVQQGELDVSNRYECGRIAAADVGWRAIPQGVLIFCISAGENVSPNSFCHRQIIKLSRDLRPPKRGNRPEQNETGPSGQSHTEANDGQT